jgi:hypothetical protein
MARPPLALGHHGTITVGREDGRRVARCRVRDRDGATRRVAAGAPRRPLSGSGGCRSPLGRRLQAGRPADFLSGDFLRIEDDELAEHWDTVEYTRLHYALGLLPEILSPRTTSSAGTGV